MVKNKSRIIKIEVSSKQNVILDLSSIIFIRHVGSTITINFHNSDTLEIHQTSSVTDDAFKKIFFDLYTKLKNFDDAASSSSTEYIVMGE